MKTYFVIIRGTQTIKSVFDGTGAGYRNSTSYLLDAYEYCYSMTKTSLKLGYEVEELEVISREEFVNKFGEDAIGLAEI